MVKKRILIVEDDAPLARVLQDNLVFEGFEIDCAGDGDAALRRARELPPDLVILDVMLPGRDGFDLIGLLRRGGKTPIIMLTARAEKADKLRGLGLGADDYVTKPFDLDELLARVHAVLRRSSPGLEQVRLGAVTVDIARRSASSAGEPLRLTRLEFDLLTYLAERSSRVVHRAELLREVWGYPDDPNTRSVDYTVARLRKKVEPDPSHPRYIHTVHGDGYQLTPGD